MNTILVVAIVTQSIFIAFLYVLMGYTMRKVVLLEDCIVEASRCIGPLQQQISEAETCGDPGQSPKTNRRPRLWTPQDGQSKPAGHDPQIPRKSS